MTAIKNFTIYAWVLGAFISFISLGIFVLLWKNFDNLFYVFNFGYEYSFFVDFFKKHISYIIPLSLGYLIFLGYIGSKKGNIFGDGVNASYFQIIILINKTLGFFMFFFIFFLIGESKYLEFISIILMIFILFMTKMALQEFSLLRKKYDDLEYISRIKLDFKKLYKEDSKNFYETWGSIFMTFTLTHFQYLTLSLSFIIPLLNPILLFNIWTVIYLHISFISLFIFFSLLKNKFPPYVTLSLGGKKRKGFLIEYGKTNTILLQGSKTLVFKTDMIESIESKNI